MDKKTLKYINKAITNNPRCYDYSLFVYQDMDTKSKIICDKHGVFEQHARYHSRKKNPLGCPSCAKDKTYRNKHTYLEEILQRCDDLNCTFISWTNDSERYSDASFSFICNTHGSVEEALIPQFLRRVSCTQCAHDLRGSVNRKGTDYYITKAKHIHGDKYDYSLVNDMSTVKCLQDIICPAHGIFKQNFDNHVNSGKGCPSCSSFGYSEYNSGVFYILYVNEDLIKFGITNQDIECRLHQINSSSIYDIKLLHMFNYDNGIHPKRIEQNILRDPTIERGVVDRLLMKQGFTEVTYSKNLVLLLKHVEDYNKFLTQAPS